MTDEEKTVEDGVTVGDKPADATDVTPTIVDDADDQADDEATVEPGE